MDGVDTVTWTDADGPDAAIATGLEGIGKLLVEPSLPSGTRALLADRLDVDPGIVAGLRARKAPDELELLLEAGRRADAAADWLAGQALAGRTESEVELSLRARFLQTGSSRTARTSSPPARTPRSRTTTSATPRSRPARRC